MTAAAQVPMVPAGFPVIGLTLIIGYGCHPCFPDEESEVLCWYSKLGKFGSGQH